MRKLDILIPIYNEGQEVVKPLLDSIAVQQNVDFDDIGVIICCDGGKTKLSKKFIESYLFQVEFYMCEHKGVSATRNACLDKSKAEYVMFCDCDDMFYMNCGMWILFREMNIGFDSLTSIFIEETRNLNGEPDYITREMDSTFVHGKVHRRKYLKQNNIRWNDKLTIHEDSYFNCLCQKLSTNVKYCVTPFYLWKWRDESVCRHDPLYLNKTYVNMLESNTALVQQFLSRKRKDDAIFFATSMIYDVYYSMNCDRWWTEEGTPYREPTEKRFKKYWDTFKDLFKECPDMIRNQIIVGIKNRFFQEGMFLEKITFDDWIKRIEEING